jgi:hypothetical protein
MEARWRVEFTSVELAGLVEKAITGLVEKAVAGPCAGEGLRGREVQ